VMSSAQPMTMLAPSTPMEDHPQMAGVRQFAADRHDFAHLIARFRELANKPT